MEFTKDIQFNMNPTVDQDVEITYHGFLSNSSDVWIVYGFGENWENTTEMKMEKSSQGFYAKIKQLNFDTFNFCFRNSNNEWDNNSSFNYITPITPSTNSQIEYNFDINKFLNELLEPLTISNVEEASLDSVEQEVQTIDLGEEISNVLSKIEYTNQEENFIEFSTLDEILSGSIIESNSINLFEENVEDIIEQESSEEILINDEVDKIVSQLIENTRNTKEENINELVNNIVEASDEVKNIINIENPVEDTIEEKSLVPIDDTYLISPRKLSTFYLFRKRVKLALYKALIKLPKLIFGTENSKH